MNRSARLAVLSLPLLAALLSGCGGGGGDDAGSEDAASTGSPAPAAAPADPAAPAASATQPAPPPAPPAVEPACGSAEFQARVLAEVNAYRAQARTCGSRGSFASAAALGWNARLEAAALGHSQDMVTNNFFGHTGSTGSTLAQRIDAQAYAWSRLAENIAAGQTTIAQVMKGWIDSEGHCANIMAPQLTEIGVACVAGTPANTYVRYWTMNLGTPR